jgi:chorismate mutase-like protein
MRKNLLSPPVAVCVMGLLVVSVAASGCRPAELPIAPRSELFHLDRLLRLMEQRLALMHDVARWKWKAGKPIEDLKRESESLQVVVERSRGKGIHPDLVRSFFAAQMASARMVQQADFDRWKAKEQEPLADTASLEALRQRIDQLNGELIDALADVSPWLSGLTVQQALPQRAEEILSGNGLASVRDTTIAPLRRGL